MCKVSMEPQPTTVTAVNPREGNFRPKVRNAVKAYFLTFRFGHTFCQIKVRLRV